MQTLHRARSRLVANNKSLLNQLRAILLERGHAFAHERRVLERAVDEMHDVPPKDLSARMIQLVADMREEWRALDRRIDGLNAQFVERARADEAASHLMSIPGIGVLNAAALVAAVGNAESFRLARDLGAWLGLVPKQMTPGDRPKLLSITKRGNTYLRMLFIHDARAAMPGLAKKDTGLGALGCGASWRARTAMSRSWPSPASLLALPGRR